MRNPKRVRRRYDEPEALAFFARKTSDEVWMDKAGVVKRPVVLRRLRRALLRRIGRFGKGRMTIHSAVLEALIADHRRLETELASSQDNGRLWMDRACRAERLLNSEG